MIVGGQTEARAQLSSTIIDYHEPFDQGLTVKPTVHTNLSPKQSFDTELHDNHVISLTEFSSNTTKMAVDCCVFKFLQLCSDVV